MRVLLAAAALSLLSGCASAPTQSKPAGVGSGPNNLRRAPCACLKLQQKDGLPAHLTGQSETAQA